MINTKLFGALSIVAGIFLGGASLAQLPITGAGCAVVCASGGGGYTGPGDVVTGARAWFGLRAYNAAQATAGVKSVNVCNTINGVTAGSCVDWVVNSSGNLVQTNVNSISCTTNFASVQATFATSVMTVTSVNSGTIVLGQSIAGGNATNGTLANGISISSFGTGTGGVGTYNLTASPGTFVNTLVYVYPCSIAIIYDQSGTNGCTSGPCDLKYFTSPLTLQSVANRPFFIPNCLGSLPCLGMNGATQNLLSLKTVSGDSPNGLQAALPNTVVGYANKAATYTGNFSLASCFSEFVFYDTGSNVVAIYAGSIQTAAASAGWHVLQGVLNGASSSIKVDTTTTSTSSPGTSVPCSTGNQIAVGGGVTTQVTQWTEGGMWGGTTNGAFSSTQLTNMYNNISAYW